MTHGQLFASKPDGAGVRRNEARALVASVMDANPSGSSIAAAQRSIALLEIVMRQAAIEILANGLPDGKAKTLALLAETQRRCLANLHEMETHPSSEDSEMGRVIEVTGQECPYT
jgi:hypothetical protein